MRRNRLPGTSLLLTALCGVATLGPASACGRNEEGRATSTREKGALGDEEAALVPMPVRETLANAAAPDLGEDQGIGTGEGEYLVDLMGCHDIVADAVLRVDENGHFNHPSVEVAPGSLVRFESTGPTPLHLVGGKFEAKGREPTCIAFNGLGVYTFEASRSPAGRVSIRVQ